VLVAKLSLGALAAGENWFGGMTRNPWNPKEGSSGSSAGSGAATAAGLVGFSLGSETLGSIISPSSRCGATGLRPTFGRVSRQGCMSLSWSMDKIGPICRSVEDCALVFGAIHGYDGQDPTAVDRPFQWPPREHVSRLTVGYIEGEKGIDERPELKTLQGIGVRLKPIRLPMDLPVDAITMILNCESAASFDDLIRGGGDTHGLNSWPRVWRAARFVPAVDYLRACRVRSLLMAQMQQVMADIDLYVGGGDDLDITNLTGHPQISLPSGFIQRDGVDVPKPVIFTGKLYGETELLAVAHAFQQATSHHLRRPPLDEMPPPLLMNGP
jgi:Asp-tRNA(Asn)/Glu-tRNA(Gln) amidotransferase A subunit family amidase